MADKYIFTNNASSLLAVAMGASDITCQVTSGDGSLFSSPSSGERAVVLIKSGSTEEYMVSTGRSGDVITVSRTGSNTFPVGATIKEVINADILNTFLQKGTEREYDGSPDGLLTANHTGEEVYDSTNGVWYKHTTGTEWKIMNGEGS